MILTAVKQPDMKGGPDTPEYWTNERKAAQNHLLLGSGFDPKRRLSHPDGPQQWMNLVKLDMNPDMNPDVVWDLNKYPLPFPENTFDEIHAYQVLEHCGTQGDFRFFLQQFADFWRILKPGGHFFGTVPMWDSPWAWGDPGHTRTIPKESLVFLSQQEYKNQVDAKASEMSDYRRWYQADFETVYWKEEEHTMAFVLKALKA